MRNITLIAHNLRSAHNVGSLLRTSEGLGVTKVFLTGYTPFPMQKKDLRMPHIAKRIDKQIAKTALGADKTVSWSHSQNINKVIQKLRLEGYIIAALEQTPAALPLHTYKAPDKIAIIVGREVEGIEPEILELCDLALEIPMLGKKESFNVVQAAAMALFYLTFTPNKPAGYQS